MYVQKCTQLDPCPILSSLTKEVKCPLQCKCKSKHLPLISGKTVCVRVSIIIFDEGKIIQLFIFARGLEFTGHFVMFIGCIPRCNSSDWEKSNNVMLIIIYLITFISRHICFEWVSFWLN